MTETRYAHYALVLTGLMLMGLFLPKIPSFLLWLLISLAIFFILPFPHVPGYLRVKKQVWGMALSWAVIFLAIRFGAGFLLNSIALSPYDLSGWGILLNLSDILPAALAKEMTRAYALGAVYRNSTRPLLWILLITLLWALFEINITKIFMQKNIEEWFVFVAKDVLPLITQSCLLTVLVWGGGAMAGLIYRGSLDVFIHIFPFLPVLPWLAESALGIAVPILMALFLWGWYKSQTRKQPVRQRERIGLFTVALTLTVSFAWFVAGVFPVYPSVILTGSMEPEMFPGDIAIIRKFATEQEIYRLTENDVVNFKREDITITHRVNAVLYDVDGNISFQTKGDNNNAADETVVLPADLNGIVKKVIPKAGIPILWLQSNNTLPQGMVDY